MALADYDLVLIHLLRNAGLLEQAKLAGLAPEDFDSARYRHYRYFWQAACEYFDAHHGMIPQPILEREIASLLARETTPTERLVRRVEDLLRLIYSIPAESLAPDYVRDNMLQQMIDDLKVAPRLKEMANESNSAKIFELFAHNQQLHDQTRIVVNRAADLFSAEGRQRHTALMQPVKTGIDFVDLATGGFRPASVVGLLAESSGGKTMMGSQFLCEQALQKHAAFGFFYEQSLEGDIAERFYSYLSGTSREELKGKTHKEYPERVRAHLDALEARMRDYLHLYDMSGSIQGQGNGGPDEVEAILGRSARQGLKPDFVVIDWLGPMVTKFYNVPKSLRQADRREKIDLVITRLKEIAERFRVTFLILHQIAAHAIEDKTPSYKPDWTVAAECKSFGYLMDYVLTFGRRCEKTDCMWFNTPKARGAAKAHRIVRMDALHNRIHDAMEYSENPMAARDDVYFKRGQPSRGLPRAGSL